ncbi:MAG: ATP synthase F0 subunit B [Bacilli bacterium]|nr:ATP synthase F0 subunit B [Bacilli bacterium]
MGNLILALPLGLSFEEILLHLLNFAVLLVAVRFLLWKPVKKIMDKRKQEYIKAKEDSVRMVKEAEELKTEYSTLVDNIEKEKAEIITKALSEAEIRAEAIIIKSKEHAENIITSAKEVAKSDAIQAEKDFEKEIATLAIDIASKVIDREINQKDNEKLIENYLNQWEKS